MSAEISYFFGRLNLIAQYQDKKSFILASLTKDILVPNRDFAWGFFSINELMYENKDFVYGYLVKYKPLLEEEVVDKSKHSISTESVSDRVVAKCDFLIHYKTGVIAYRPVSNKVKPEQFRIRFAEVLKKANDNFFVDADIQTIQEEYKIIEAIKKFESIKKIAINLHPSNPNNRDIWKRTDERLRAMHVEKYKEEYETKNPNGMYISEDSDAYANIIMANDGYGKADIEGELKGHSVKASTDETPIQTTAPSVEDAEHATKKLLKTFRRIWERITP